MTPITEDTEMLRRIAIANAEVANMYARLMAMQIENYERRGRSEALAWNAEAFESERNLNYIHELLRP